MGLFDDVHLEYETPELPGIPRDFQTKSLDPSMDHYTITKAGRLVRNPAGKFRWEIEGEPEEPAKPEEPVDIDFHGDMCIYASDGEFKEYVVRFTHGTVEWIKPIGEVSKELLLHLR